MVDHEDLIERLRQLASNTGKMTWFGDKPMTASDALNKAADALEAQAREIERLRAALTRLRDCDWVITPLDRMDAVREIAREALNG